MKVVCSCGKTLQIPDTLAGHSVRCPFCSAAVEVPAPAPDDPTASLIQTLKNQPGAAPAQDEHVAALAATIQKSAARNPPRPAPRLAASVPLVAPQRRDLLHYYLAGGGIVLLVVIIIIVIACSDNPPPPPPPVVVVTPPITHVAAQPASETDEDASTAKFHPLFGDTPGGDSKAYEKRTGQKITPLH